MSNNRQFRQRGARLEPTHTSKVMDALAHAPEDFMTAHQLVLATGSNHNQVSAALHSLRRHGAVDVVVEADGRGWWFATPGTDSRTRILELRAPEDKPRRRRKSRVRKAEIASPAQPCVLGDNPNGPEK